MKCVLPGGNVIWRLGIVDDKVISQAVVARLPRYYRYLGDLKNSGIERISSQDLSALMKVTASQIRQDFNNFGGFGQQGYGYKVDSLKEEIGEILGISRGHTLVVLGTGNLGRAIIQNFRFSTSIYTRCTENRRQFLPLLTQCIKVYLHSFFAASDESLSSLVKTILNGTPFSPSHCMNSRSFFCGL